MTDNDENVKAESTGVLARFEEWLRCHPRTLAYLVFFLALNYLIDFIGGVFF